MGRTPVAEFGVMSHAESTSTLILLKVGGGLAADPTLLADIGAAIAERARKARFVVVPGGGPFADQVRAFDRQYGLTATAAHWMAILGMDQYAWALADRIASSVVVDDRPGVLAAHDAGRVPVLAPSRWLRAADELPHHWDVTSDALAAYLATLLGADALWFLKPVPGGRELLDPWFDRALPAGLPWRVLGAREFVAGA